MVITAIYTGAPGSLIEKVDAELSKALPQAKIRFCADPTIIQEVSAQGGVQSRQAARLVKMYVDAACAGADVVYNICSSVGDVADAAAPAIRAMGVKFVRIDEAMAEYAVTRGSRIGVITTLRTTLEPTKRLIGRCAAAQGKQVTLVDALADAFGKSQAEMETLLIEQALSIKDRVDVIVLAQASMALCEERIAAACGKEVLSSPRFGAAAVKKALEE